jgi:cation:H+ antiporter|tara:strand:+ start:153 stop:1088 length:936 start_codon:yes stop_codon:yes gene_type:complete
LDYLLLILGLAVLIFGGDLLVKGASGIALKLNMDPMVVGLTVVSLGTSAPELIVSIKSALNGNPDIAMGNVVGSNIANLGLVLAITAIMFPIAVNRKVLRIDWPVMVFFAALAFIFGLDNLITRFEGGVLLVTLVVYIYKLLQRGKSHLDNGDIEIDTDTEKESMMKLILLLLGGMVALYLGSEWFLGGAMDIGRSFNLSESVIGVTIVAFGTSTPELAASAIAAYRKETDIALGNLLGSNIFNIGAVLGTTSIISPLVIDAKIMNIDILWMLGIAGILFPLMVFKKKLSLLSGIILFSLYCIFIFSQIPN